MNPSAPTYYRPSSVVIACALLLAALAPINAPAAQQGPEAALHVLDYIGVDYPATVQDGKVVDQAEYAEQSEFAERLEHLLTQLPEHPMRSALLEQTRDLRQDIRARAPGAQVAAGTHAIRKLLIEAYNVTVTPLKVPDLGTASGLYQNNCAGCHGADGRGDGTLAAGLEPHPTNFHDPGRAHQRSVYGLYSAITQGVDGTAMRAFSELSRDQRWALAFYVGNLAFTDRQRAQGATLWQQAGGQHPLDSLKQITQLTPAQVRSRYGDDGLAVLAYLRGNPAATAAGKATPLELAQERLAESAVEYRQGNRESAYERALSAYLDGFELAESSLRTVAPGLVSRIEEEMLTYRKLIRSGAPLAEVEHQHKALAALLANAAQQQEDTRLTPSMGFASALVILLREGLEAILILAAVGGVLIKTGRRDALPYLHAGWIAALLLGFATWGVSSYLIAISGAGRELTEGLTALLAAVMLLYVGFWLHGKSHAQRWQVFVKERIQKALHGRALWLLALISFLAVYREVFETVLFYQALWLQSEPSSGPWIWSGIGVGGVALVALTWVIVRSSVRLPLRVFFNLNSIIMLILAVTFAGHGIAGLQEAGALPADPVSFPRIGLLGVYPTAQTLAAQAIVIALVAAVLLYERRSSRRSAIVGSAQASTPTEQNG